MYTVVSFQGKLDYGCYLYSVPIILCFVFNLVILDTVPSYKMSVSLGKNEKHLQYSLALMNMKNKIKSKCFNSR